MKIKTILTPLACFLLMKFFRTCRQRDNDFQKHH